MGNIILDDKYYLNDIIYYCSLIMESSDGLTEEMLHQNIMLFNHFLTYLVCIGNDVGKLTYELRDRYPDIEWKKIYGLRNKISHDYMGLDYNLIFNSVVKDVPKLKNDAIIILQNDFQ